MVVGIRRFYNTTRAAMEIDEIGELMVGKTIEEVNIVYGEDVLVIYLSCGSSIEIVVDSIYADIPDLDD
jgi:hypothetical protein